MNLLLEQTQNGEGDSDRHALTLFSLAVSLNAKRILELGVRNGDTTNPLLMAAKATGGCVTSVDINNTNFKPTEELNAHWNFVQMDALEYLASLKPSETCWDLIYVDDWHAYEHVKKELEYIDTMVSPSSIILLHDLMYANYEPHYHCDLALKSGQWAGGGAYRAVAELSENFWEFSTIPVCNGLTLLRKKYSSKFYK